MSEPAKSSRFRNRRPTRLVAAAAVVLAATAANAAPVGSGRCDEARAAKLVGGPAPSDAEAREATGANIIRRIKPGQPVTMDFSASRVTLEIVDGKVVAVRCG